MAAPNSHPINFKQARYETIFYTTIGWLISLVPWLINFNATNGWNIWMTAISSLLLCYALLPGIHLKKINRLLFGFFLLWITSAILHFVWSHLIGLYFLFDRILYYNYQYKLFAGLSDRLERWYNHVTS